MKKVKETKAWCMHDPIRREIFPSTIYKDRRNVASRLLPKNCEIIQIAIRVITKRKGAKKK